MLMRAFFLAALCGTCNAQSSIEILDQHYSTSVSAVSLGLTGSKKVSSSLTSTTTPLADTVSVPPQSPYSSDPVVAAAAAGPLAVSASVDAHYGGAEAIAESLLSFRVLSTYDGPLTVDFEWLPIPNVSFSASLQDLTADESVFSFSGLGSLFGPSGFVFSYSFAPLVQSHLYSLRLYSKSSEDADPGRFAIQVGGLSPLASPAPEPATWAMMLAGLAVVGGLVRWRRRNRH